MSTSPRRPRGSPHAPITDPSPAVTRAADRALQALVDAIHTEARKLDGLKIDVPVRPTTAAAAPPERPRSDTPTVDAIAAAISYEAGARIGEEVTWLFLARATLGDVPDDSSPTDQRRLAGWLAGRHRQTLELAAAWYKSAEGWQALIERQIGRRPRLVKRRFVQPAPEPEEG